MSVTQNIPRPRSLPLCAIVLLLSLLVAGCSQSARPFFTGDTPNRRLLFTGLDPEGIRNETSRVLALSKTRFLHLKGLKDNELTRRNVIVGLDDLMHGIWKYGGPLYLMGYAHPDPAVRKASLDTIARLERFSTSLFLDKDLFEVFKRFAATPAATRLSGEYRKALEDTLRNMKQNGLALPDKELALVKSYRNQLMKLGMEFNKNIRDSQNSLLIKKGPQTAGLYPRYLKQREEKPGVYRIDLTYPSFFPFLKNAEWAEGRKRLYTMYQQRARKQNIPLLKKILLVRKKLAALLGYSNYAAYILEERMAKNSRTVWTFLRTLQKKLAPMAKQDIALLTQAKRKALKKQDARLEIWDVFYYAARVRENRFQLDMEKVREYFPVPAVINGLFSISQRLFGLEFRRVRDASVWHKDVLLYEAHDRKDGRLVGRFYLDLYPRPGKYGHAAMFSMVNGKKLTAGYQRPTFTLVCNFPRGDGKTAGLLSFDEVETFFHEFGHGMHGLLSTTSLQMFSGTEVARDFVEMPSQFFENWIYLPKVLKSFAKHYQTGKPIPAAMIASLIKARTFLAGYNNTKQIFYASYDMTLNDGFDPQKDTTALYEAMHNRITGLSFIPGTAPEASFGHLIGYAAGYYGYLWSKVYAQDVFSPFKNGVDPVLGARLRQTIFSRGGSEDPMRLLIRFLGRKPREDAFLKTIGLK